MSESSAENTKILAVTLNRVLNPARGRGPRPILHVLHPIDEEWLVLDAEPFTTTDLVGSSLPELSEHDPTLAEITDLPTGWAASRDGPHAPWTRNPTRIIPTGLRLRRVLARTLQALGIYAACLLVIYLAFGLIHTAIRPATPSEGWVVDPPRLMRGMAAVFAAAFATAPALVWLKRRWHVQCLLDGRLPRVPRGLPMIQRRAQQVVGLVLLLVMLLVSLMVTRGFTVIGPIGIHHWMLSGTKFHPYASLHRVEIVPEGHWVPGRDLHGPIIWAYYEPGRAVQIEAGPGLARSDVELVAQFIKDRTNAPVIMKPGAESDQSPMP